MVFFLIFLSLLRIFRLVLIVMHDLLGGMGTAMANTVGKTSFFIKVLCSEPFPARYCSLHGSLAAQASSLCACRACLVITPNSDRMCPPINLKCSLPRVWGSTTGTTEEGAMTIEAGTNSFESLPGAEAQRAGLVPPPNLATRWLRCGALLLQHAIRLLPCSLLRLFLSASEIHTLAVRRPCAGLLGHLG